MARVPELTRPIPDWRGRLTITKFSPSSYRLCRVHVHVHTCNERTLCSSKLGDIDTAIMITQLVQLWNADRHYNVGSAWAMPFQVG